MEDTKLTMTELTQKATDGDAEAQFDPGVLYYNKQDFTEAKKWFSKSAEQGNPNSQFNLGAMYTNDHGVEQNYGEALKWFSAAAEQLHAEAQRNLGVMYTNGYGVQQNFVEAEKWFIRAALLGSEGALKVLEMIFKTLEKTGKLDLIFKSLRLAMDRLRKQLTLAQIRKGQEMEKQLKALIEKNEKNQ